MKRSLDDKAFDITGPMGIYSDRPWPSFENSIQYYEPSVSMGGHRLGVFHYSDIKLASVRLKSPTTKMFVQ